MNLHNCRDAIKIILLLIMFGVSDYALSAENSIDRNYSEPPYTDIIFV